MSDLDKTMRKALLSTSDVIHDPGAAIAEITRLTERNAELEAECELLAEDNDRAQQVITAHWHNLERERNRADTLTDRNAELEAECERLKTLGSDYDLEELLRIYTALHDGKVTAHWLWVAIERIGAGESVTECLEDYGYITEQRADQLQAKLDAVRRLPRFNMDVGYPRMDRPAGTKCVATRNGEWVRFADIQQALNAPETA